MGHADLGMQPRETRHAGNLCAKLIHVEKTYRNCQASLPQGEEACRRAADHGLRPERKGETPEASRIRQLVRLVPRHGRGGCSGPGGSPGKDGVEGLGRSSARLSDRRSDPAHGQEARSGDQRPHLDPDVPVDAARRRKGDDRAGASRRAADRAHFRGSDGAGGRRPQRLQHAVHLPRRKTHAQGDRRPDRPGPARPRLQRADLAADRARLDGRRHAQRLCEQARHQTRRPEGHEDPHDGQSDLRRNDECHGRQRRGDGFQRALQRVADRRRGWCGEQPADGARAKSLPGQQGLQPHRAPHHSRDLRLFEEELGDALQG